VEARHEALVDEDESSDTNERQQAHHLAMVTSVMLSGMFAVLLVVASRSLHLVLLIEVRTIDRHQRSGLGLLINLNTETSKFLTNVVHESGQVNMFVLVHKIAVNKGSGDVFQVISSVARGFAVIVLISPAAHANDERRRCAPSTPLVVMAGIHFFGSVAYLLVTINLHAHDVSELLDKFLMSSYLILFGDLRAIIGGHGKVFGIAERSALISDILSSTPGAGIDGIARITVSLGFANFFFGSCET
jgi:lysylphosphatidylglycerol synthetase-like protein (DUF2156 family)